MPHYRNTGIGYFRNTKIFNRSLPSCVIFFSIFIPIQCFAENNVQQLPTIQVDIEKDADLNQSYTTKKLAVASKVPVELKDIPQSVSLVTNQRIRDQKLTNVEDALRTVTGITVIPNDSEQSQYKSRGYSLNSAMDGIPTLQGLSGQLQFDLTIYDHLEVLRGPSGLLSGTGDIGGTVNLVTKKAQKDFAVTGSLSSGSWSNRRADFDITGPLNKDKTLRGRFVGVAQDKDFFYDKAHQKKFVGSGILEYDFDDQTTASLRNSTQRVDTDASYAGLPANKQTKELFSLPRSTNPSPNWLNTTTTINETSLWLEHHFSDDWKAVINTRYSNSRSVALDDYVWSGVDPYTWTTTYASPSLDRYKDIRKSVDIYVGGPFQLFNLEHNFLIGYNYDSYRHDDISGYEDHRYNNISIFNPEAIPKPNLIYIDGNSKVTNQQGVYSQARLKIIQPLTLTLGGRMSNYTARSRDIAPSKTTSLKTIAKQNHEFTPYAGLVYEITPEISAYTSYSDIFIPQSSQTADHKTLDPRKGKQYEVGIKGGFLDNRLNASLAAFKINDVNRAFRDPAYPNAKYYIAAGEVESKGVDAEISGSPLTNWDITVGYTHFINKYLKDTANQGLAASTAEPKDSLKLWNTYHFIDGTFEGLKLGTGVTATSRYAGSRGTQLDRQQAGFVLWDVIISYDLNQSVNLDINVENITNKKYYASIGGLNTYNTYGTPRSTTLSVNFKY